MASLNIARCILSGVLVAVTDYIAEAIGLGWTFTIYALVALLFPIPVTAVLIRYGARQQKIREERAKKSAQVH